MGVKRINLAFVAAAGVIAEMFLYSMRLCDEKFSPLKVGLIVRIAGALWAGAKDCQNAKIKDCGPG